MAKPDWRTRLNTTWRKRVFASALRAIVSPRASWPGPNVVIAYLVATLILLATVLFAAIGLYLILFDFPNLLAGILGAVFFALAYIARPRIFSGQPGHPRGSFPALEQLLDQISAALQAPAVTTIEFSSDWNASIRRAAFGRDVHLVLGLPLLFAAPPAARAAILTHEIAHLVNGDPQRGSYIAAARETVSKWLETFGYQEIIAPMSDVAGTGEVLRQIAALCLFSLRGLMDRANFFDSQRAEYIADGLSARLIGDTAMQDALLLIASGFHLDKELQSFIPQGADRGTETMLMLRDKAQLPPHAARERDQRMQRTLSRADFSHPPTAYRLAFLETLGPLPGQIDIAPQRWNQIDAEWSPFLEPMGKAVLSRRQMSC